MVNKQVLNRVKYWVIFICFLYCFPGDVKVLTFLFFTLWRCFFISTKELLINEQIKAAQVRVIDDTGAQIGVMKTRDAQALADEKGFDLVQIVPNAEIPVCRITDYGKFKFEKAKKEKEAKKKQVIIETKEIQLSCNIDVHDFNTRLRHTQKFIDEGNKVKVCLEFQRGRQMAHMELGYQLLEKFEVACTDFCIVEKRPVREGRRITMFLAPKKSREEREKEKAAALKQEAAKVSENAQKPDSAAEKATEA